MDKIVITNKRILDFFKTHSSIEPESSFLFFVELLEKFGGPLNIETYRDSCNILNKSINITIPPMIPLLSYYEEHNISC